MVLTWWGSAKCQPPSRCLLVLGKMLKGRSPCARIISAPLSSISKGSDAFLRMRLINAHQPICESSQALWPFKVSYFGSTASACLTSTGRRKYCQSRNQEGSNVKALSLAADFALSS